LIAYISANIIEATNKLPSNSWIVSSLVLLVNKLVLGAIFGFSLTYWLLYVKCMVVKWGAFYGVNVMRHEMCQL
jgi:hypothetical protein